MAILGSTRKISCDFFQVSLGRDGNQSFISTINAIHKNKPNVRDRNIQIGDDYMRIHGWTVNGKNAYGALLRLRVRNNASIARLDLDDLRSLELQKGEILTEYYGFRFYGEFNVLVVHRNKDAGSISRLESYLNELLPECRPVVMAHVPASDPWARMDQLRDISIVEVTIARPSSLAIFRGSGKSAQEVGELTSDSNAEYLTLRFSMGHTRRSLSDEIKNFLREIRDLGVIHSASVHGRQVYKYKKVADVTRDETTIIDLVSDHIQDKVLVEIPDNKLDIGDIYLALEKAYERRYDDLATQFSLKL